jgi:hypothetical protein
MSSIGTSAFEDFDALAALFGRTRLALDKALDHGHASRPDVSLIFRPPCGTGGTWRRDLWPCVLLD